MILAAVIFVLMAIWVSIYISCIYDKNDQFVYVNGIDRRGQMNKKKCDVIDKQNRNYQDDPDKA